jgi:hypothetical protein
MPAGWSTLTPIAAATFAAVSSKGTRRSCSQFGSVPIDAAAATASWD